MPRRAQMPQGARRGPREPADHQPAMANGGADIPVCRESMSGGIPAPRIDSPVLAVESTRRKRVRFRTRGLKADKNVCPTKVASACWDQAHRNICSMDVLPAQQLPLPENT